MALTKYVERVQRMDQLFPLIGIGAYHLSAKLMYGKKLEKIDEMIVELGGNVVN